MDTHCCCCCCCCCSRRVPAQRSKSGTIFMAGNCTPWPHRTTDPQLGTAKTINHMDTHTIAHGARAWIPTHNRTARLTNTTRQHTWRSVKDTRTVQHDKSHDNMPHIPLTYLWCRLVSAPRQSATYTSSAKLATLPTCLTQDLRPVPHAAKTGFAQIVMVNQDG